MFAQSSNRLRTAVIHNDYASLPNKKGLPDGHAELVREVVVPVFRQDKIRAILNNVAEAASSDMTWKAIDRYSQDYIELQTKDKVKFYKTPDSVLQKQLEIFDTVMSKRKDNALFQEIIESQRKFAERVVRWDLDTYANRRMAYNYYFSKQATSGAGATKKG